MKIKNTLRKIGIVIGIILLVTGIILWVSLFSLRFYQLAVERECGWNPINHFFKARFNELWCDCGTKNLYYGGFSCMTCERFCEKYQIATSETKGGS